MTKKEIRSKTARLKRACAKLEKFLEADSYIVSHGYWHFYAALSAYKNEKYYTVMFTFSKTALEAEIKIEQLTDDKDKVRGILKPWSDLIIN